MNNEQNYIDTIMQAHAGMDYGTVVLFLKKHGGIVSTVDAQKIWTTNTPKGNEGAIEIVVALINAMSHNKESGELTFTIHMNKGISQKVMVQDMKRVDFINRK